MALLAILYALFVWWFTTGLVLLIVLRPQRRARVASLAGAAVLFPAALYVLSMTSAATDVTGAYVAFSAAIVAWGTQEVAFLTGAITGPRPLACPAGARGIARVGYALGAILWHELALILSGLAVAAATWHASNQIGALTFFVLWIMRISAKLNLFLGVPVLNDDFLPRPVQHVRSYFRRAPAGAFFAISIAVSVLGLAALVGYAADTAAPAGTRTGYTLVAALMGLAILEHVFMLVPLPIDLLWRWSTKTTAGVPLKRSISDAPRDGDIERVAATSP